MKCQSCNKKLKKELEVTVNDQIELNCIECFIKFLSSDQILNEFFKGTFFSKDFKEYYEFYDFQNKIMLPSEYECRKCHSLLNSFKVSSNFKFECVEECHDATLQQVITHIDSYM